MLLPLPGVLPEIARTQGMRTSGVELLRADLLVDGTAGLGQTFMSSTGGNSSSPPTSLAHPNMMSPRTFKESFAEKRLLAAHLLCSNVGYSDGSFDVHI